MQILVKIVVLFQNIHSLNKGKGPLVNKFSCFSGQLSHLANLWFKYKYKYT